MLCYAILCYFTLHYVVLTDSLLLLVRSEYVIPVMLAMKLMKVFELLNEES